MLRTKIRVWSAVTAIFCVVAIVALGGNDDGDDPMKQKRDDVKVITLKANQTGGGVRLAYKFISTQHGTRGEWANPFAYTLPNWQQSMQIEKGDAVTGWVDVIVAYEGSEFSAGCQVDVDGTVRDGPKQRKVSRRNAGWLIRCQWTESNV